MSEPPEEARPAGPADQGGVTPPWSPAGQPQRYAQAATPGVPQTLATSSVAVPDRPAVYLIWDGVLLVVTAALVGVALATTHQAHLADILRPAGYLGFIAAGFALSLRTGTPNLAVGPIATVTGVVGAHLASADGWSLWTAMTLAVAIAAAAGLIAGLVVAGLSVPAWAATLAVALLAGSVALVISSDQPIPLRVTGSYPTVPWLAAFAAVSVGGGALWLAPGVRNSLSGARRAGEPGQWAGLLAGLSAVAGLTGSSLLAGVGGASMANYLQVADPASGAINLTLVALAAALVGGVSVFGRRAGVLGTVLGVVIVQTVLFLINVHGVSSNWIYISIAGLVILGLCVSRALESITDALNQRRTLGV